MAAAQYINDISQTTPVAGSICPGTGSPFPWSQVTNEDKYEASCGGQDYELEIQRTVSLDRYDSIITDLP